MKKQQVFRAGLGILAVGSIAAFGVTAWGEPLPAPSITSRVPAPHLPPALPTITVKPIITPAPANTNPNNVTVPNGKAIAGVCPDTMTNASNQQAGSWFNLWYGGSFISSAFQSNALNCYYGNAQANNTTAMQTLGIFNKTNCAISAEDHKTLLCDK